MHPQPSRFYLPQLDGLRFVAFLLVFIHNAPSISSSKIWTALHEYGWIGVDLFFCLSGFLITKLLVTEHEQTGKINIRNFYIRRILRIWPLYFFYISLIFLFPNLFQRNYTEHEFLQVAGLITFTFNIIYVYLFPFTTTLFIHLWTISFEKQFYLISPWLIRVITRATPRNRLGILGAIFLAGTLLRALFIHFQIEHPAIYSLPFFHFESTLGGIVIGLGLFDNFLGKINPWIMLIAGGVFNSLVIILPNIYETNWHLMASYLFVGAGMTLILFAVLHQKDKIPSSLLLNPFLVYLGKTSYGLYVFHVIGIGLAFRCGEAILSASSPEELNTFVFFSGLMIAVAFSTISYRIVERPFLKLKEMFGIVHNKI